MPSLSFLDKVMFQRDSASFMIEIGVAYSVCWPADSFTKTHVAQPVVSKLLFPLQIYVPRGVLGQWYLLCPTIFLHKGTSLLFDLASVKGSCQAHCPVFISWGLIKDTWDVLCFPQSDSLWDHENSSRRRRGFMYGCMPGCRILSICTHLFSCMGGLLCSLLSQHEECVEQSWFEYNAH